MSLDWTIPRLLLDPRGTVTRREYRAGMSVVLSMALTLLCMAGLSSLDMMMIAWVDIEGMQAGIFNNRLISQYVPQIVPLGFLVSWSSFILAYKRCRGLGAGPGYAAFSGTLHYLLFASVNAAYLVVDIYDRYRHDTQADLSNTLVIISGVILLGAVNALVLLFAQGRDERTGVFEPKGGAVWYALRLGWLGLFSIALGAATAILFVFFALAGVPLPDGSALMPGVCALAIGGFHIGYTVRRLRDAGIGADPVIWPLAVSAAAIVLKYRVGDGVNVFYNLLFALILTALIAGQYLLILLPSKTQIEH